MFELPNLRYETRYALPSADQILFNRHSVLDYSYHFRQAKWALKIIDSDLEDLDRADLVDHAGSGFDARASSC
jgi:endonuclease G